MQWREFLSRKARAKDDKKYIDEFGNILKAMAKDAKGFSVGGVQVAQLVSGGLNKSLLAKEQPEVIKQYTRYMTTEQFDEQAFKGAEPELWNRYRAQRLVLMEEGPSIEGLG